MTVNPSLWNSHFPSFPATMASDSIDIDGVSGAVEVGRTLRGRGSVGLGWSGERCLFGVKCRNTRAQISTEGRCYVRLRWPRWGQPILRVCHGGLKSLPWQGAHLANCAAVGHGGMRWPFLIRRRRQPSQVIRLSQSVAPRRIRDLHAYHYRTSPSPPLLVVGE